MTVISNLKPGIAARRIALFEKRFGQAHLFLAYHAAFPLVLTSDLLYSLWINFRQNIRGQALNIPWIAVADLMLSSLCNEVGYEIYQMDATVRQELLNRLQKDDCFGKRRIEELSKFLLDYIRQQLQSDDLEIQNIAKAQRWAALGYTRPHKTTYELALAFSQLDFDHPAEILRMLALLEALALPRQEFQSLLNYAHGIAAFVRGNMELAARLLNDLVDVNNQIRIAGVSLPTPTPVLSRISALRSQGKPNFSHENLQGRSFKGQDLTGADFSYSNIQGADFTKAILVGANFAYSKADLQNIWLLVLIFCSIFLSLASGIGAIISGYYLQTLLINPNNEATCIFAISVLILFPIICVVILRRGIEATIGACSLSITGILALGAMGLPAIWSWPEKTILAIAGIIAVIIGGSGARLGVLGFLGKWSNRLTLMIGITFGSWSLLLMRGYKDSARSISDIADPKFKAWLESVLTSTQFELDKHIILAISIALFATVGFILLEAVGMAVAMLVNKTLAVTVGLSWIPIWLIFLILSETELSSAGSLLILTSMAGLGFYVGWQAINGSDKYAFVLNTAVATTSLCLKSTSFQGADLRNANFYNTTLKCVDFSDANLKHTSWFQAKKLEFAYLGITNLQSPKIRKLVIAGLGQGQNFDHLCLSGLNLSGADLAEASFIGTNLSGTNLQNANLSGAKLIRANLEQTDLTGACLTGACIQDWKINTVTKLDGVECDYIYTNLATSNNPNPHRQPENYQRIFEPGEFADFILISTISN